MDHGEKYWHKQSYEYQKGEIHLELAKLVEYWGKTPRNINLLMNRCIKYTGFSVSDPKNAAIKNELLEMIEIEKAYKKDPYNMELEKKLLSFFGNEAKTDDDNDIWDYIFDELETRTPQSVISITRYDDEDMPIDTMTGTFREIFSNIVNPQNYYYRVAVLDQNTIRERVKAEHFGVKTSCLGGLEFSIPETLNRYLNKQVANYCKGKDENFFYLLCKYQWYTSKLLSFSKNTEKELNEQINCLQSAFPKLKAVKNLSNYKNITGIYIMVLDGYHVFYIGQAYNIQQRIMRHWSRSDYYTGTGIDLFKAFDTTRLFVLECNKENLNSIEYQMTQLVNERYELNVLTGGDIGYHEENNLPIINTERSIYENFNPFSIYDQVASFSDNFILKNAEKQ